MGSSPALGLAQGAVGSSGTEAGVLAMGRGMMGKAICDGRFQRTTGEGDMEVASGFLQKVRPNQCKKNFRSSVEPGAALAELLAAGVSRSWLGFRQE